MGAGVDRGELCITFFANLEALTIATLISLGLAYLTVLEGLRPIIGVLSKFRYMSMVGLVSFSQLPPTISIN